MLFTLAAGLIISVLLETPQWFGWAGVTDIDNVILNVTGTALGIGVYALLRHRFVGNPRGVLASALTVVVAVCLVAMGFAAHSFGVGLGM